MPIPITDSDDDAEDTTSRGLQNQLNRVNDILVRANTRLDRIRARFAEPPIPDKPAMIATLEAIKTQAEHSTRVANELIALIGR
jgi:hypothetical protein